MRLYNTLLALSALILAVVFVFLGRASSLRVEEFGSYDLVAIDHKFYEGCSAQVLGYDLQNNVYGVMVRCPMLGEGVIEVPPNRLRRIEVETTDGE